MRADQGGSGSAVSGADGGPPVSPRLREINTGRNINSSLNEGKRVNVEPLAGLTGFHFWGKK